MRERRRANLDRLMTIRADLDRPMILPPSESSPTPEPRRSEPTPMPASTEISRDDADLLLPQRTTHGGFYGPAVLARVIANYFGGR